MQLVEKCSSSSYIYLYYHGTTRILHSSFFYHGCCLVVIGSIIRWEICRKHNCWIKQLSGQLRYMNKFTVASPAIGCYRLLLATIHISCQQASLHRKKNGWALVIMPIISMYNYKTNMQEWTNQPGVSKVEAYCVPRLRTVAVVTTVVTWYLSFPLLYHPLGRIHRQFNIRWRWQHLIRNLYLLTDLNLILYGNSHLTTS